MSIKTQQKLMFIPFLNSFIFFYWIFYAMRKQNTSHSDFLKTLLLIFISLALINLPRMILFFAYGNEIINLVSFCLVLYLSPLCIDYWIIRCEKKQGVGWDGKMDKMPEIYCSINVSFDLSVDLLPIINRLNELDIKNIIIQKPRLESKNYLIFAEVKNEPFWYLEDALSKMFSYVDKNIAEMKEVITQYKGEVFIDIAFYQYGTYPALSIDGENMKKVHFLNADIGIDPY